jgi:hypothetical protein
MKFMLFEEDPRTSGRIGIQWNTSVFPFAVDASFFGEDINTAQNETQKLYYTLERASVFK